jgi:ketosteroid isomerase-like protein
MSMNPAIEVLANHECRSKRMHMPLIQHRSFIPPIVLVLLCAVPLCVAQQTRADRGSQLSDMKTFQQVEDRWSHAITKRDQYALELVLSPELIDVSASGDQKTRNQQIAMLFDKNAAPLSLDQRVINVRSFGGVALVIGTYVEQQRINGKLVRQKGKFTHVYQRVHSNWLCVSAQRTPETEPALQKPQEARQQSDAEPVIESACRSVR